MYRAKRQKTREHGERKLYVPTPNRENAENEDVYITGGFNNLKCHFCGKITIS